MRIETISLDIYIYVFMGVVGCTRVGGGWVSSLLLWMSFLVCASKLAEFIPSVMCFAAH